MAFWMIQSILFCLENLIRVKMFWKYFLNPVKLSFIYKEKTGTACIYIYIYKVYKKWPKLYYICSSFNFLMLCIKLKLIIFCCKIYLACFILLFTLLYTMLLVDHLTVFSVLYVQLYFTFYVNKSIKQGEYLLQQKIITYNFFTIKEN